jgi:hypothetical protein
MGAQSRNSASPSGLRRSKRLTRSFDRRSQTQEAMATLAWSSQNQRP